MHQKRIKELLQQKVAAEKFFLFNILLQFLNFRVLKINPNSFSTVYLTQKSHLK